MTAIMDPETNDTACPAMEKSCTDCVNKPNDFSADDGTRVK